MQLAKWRETLVAVKVLRTGGIGDDDAVVPTAVITLSDPTLAELRKVGGMALTLHHSGCGC